MKTETMCELTRAVAVVDVSPWASYVLNGSTVDITRVSRDGRASDAEAEARETAIASSSSGLKVGDGGCERESDERIDKE